MSTGIFRAADAMWRHAVAATRSCSAFPCSRSCRWRQSHRGKSPKPFVQVGSNEHPRRACQGRYSRRACAGSIALCDQILGSFVVFQPLEQELLLRPRLCLLLSQLTRLIAQLLLLEAGLLQLLSPLAQFDHLPLLLNALLLELLSLLLILGALRGLDGRSLKLRLRLRTRLVSLSKDGTCFGIPWLEGRQHP